MQTHKHTWRMILEAKPCFYPTDLCGFMLISDAERMCHHVFCASGHWTLHLYSVQGPQGKQGMAGLAGADGPPVSSAFRRHSVKNPTRRDENTDRIPGFCFAGSPRKRRSSRRERNGCEYNEQQLLFKLDLTWAGTGVGRSHFMFTAVGFGIKVQIR